MPSLITPLASGDNILCCVFTAILTSFKMLGGAFK